MEIEILNIKQQINEILLKVYPVGSIYMSTKNTNPGTLFGGTWTAWGSGRVPVGINTSDTSFNTVEKTGGSKSHSITSSEMPSHNHTFSATTGGRVTVPGTTNSDFGNGLGWVGGGDGNIAYVDGNTDNRVMNAWRDKNANHAHTVSGTTGNRGSGTAMSLLQPYITCYMWKRTA